MGIFTTFSQKFQEIGTIPGKKTSIQSAIKSFSWIVFWTFIASITWSIMLYAIGQAKAAVFPLIASIGIPLSVLIFHINKNFSAHVNRYLTMLLLLPALVQIFHGGFINSGAVICWSVITPLMALAFKKPKQARITFFLFVLILFVTAIVEFVIEVPYNVMSKEVVTLQFLMNFAGVMSLCFFPILGFSKVLYKTRKKLRSNNKQIIHSINYAKYIQTAILQSKEQLNNLLNHNSFLFFQPKDIVSGDFYWAHKDEDYTFLACADCTGHGVPGAFMTMIGINHLNSIIRENNEKDPAKILTLLHQRVISSLKNAGEHVHDGMDITICKINFKSKEVQYSSAMSKVFLYNGDRIVTCPVNKASIGDSRRDISYTNTCLQLEEGNILYLTTDGYIDQFGGERDKKFGTNQLTSLLNSLKEENLAEQENQLKAQFYSWKSDRDQIDDVTFIGIKF